MKSLKIIVVMSFMVVALVCLATLPNPVAGSQAATNAPTMGMTQLNPDSDLFNGFGTLGTPVDECVADPVPERSFEDNLFIFNEVETVADGLGPTYNDRSCGICHNNPVTGGSSQLRELRAGNTVNGVFSEPPSNQNRSLIQLQALSAAIVENLNVIPTQNTRAFRTTLSVIGDGFIEAIDSNDIEAVRLAQPAGFVGTRIEVGVTEAGGLTRTGRFGIKNQHASLVSFASDAYLNEMN